MAFVSYSQNFEDVMLWRALKDVQNGFYVDVGAADPHEGSVTAGFYELGWRGVNIEPQEAYFHRLSQARPRDINLQCVAGANSGACDFYSIQQPAVRASGPTGLSTTCKDIAERHARDGFAVSEQSVKVIPLAEVMREHAAPVIHFLKIDVEGGERETLLGMDFSAFRPWIVLIEATEPNSAITTHDRWEELIVRAGYHFVWFDGLNRFYVSDEKFDALAPHFTVQPNVTDDFTRAPARAFAHQSRALEDPFVSQTPREIDAEARIDMTASCQDCDDLPKVPHAGTVIVNADGSRHQLMHNGIKVVADGYCGAWMTRLIERCKGHHEPQEERLFHEVLSQLPDDATMIELGGYWSYYSMWFLKDRRRRRAIILEPDPSHRAIGEANLKLNAMSATYVSAFVGPQPCGPTPFQTERSGVVSLVGMTLPQLMKEQNVDYLDILHCDTQGAELDVLMSSEELLRNGKIGWLFVSTHDRAISGDALTHQRCLAFLRNLGAVIIAEHDVHESFSGDGLIVARFVDVSPDWRPVALSRNRYSTSLFRNPLFDLQEMIARRGALTDDDVAAVVKGVYAAILMRSPDALGLANATRKLIEGELDVRRLIENMLRSKEFKSKRPIFEAKYFAAYGSNIDVEQIPYLSDSGAATTTGFLLTLKAKGPLGEAGESILAPSDKTILPSLFATGEWQNDVLSLALQTVDRTKRLSLVDIGANIGLFSRAFLSAFPTIDTVIAVEPEPRNFAALQYNLAKFSDRRRRYFHNALGVADEERTFFKDNDNIGNYSLSRDAMRVAASFDEIRVPVLDAKRWAEDEFAALDHILLKTDTQGWDEAIISRLPQPFWERIVFACIEIWQIEKPVFDVETFRAFVASFPNRSFGSERNGEIDDIIRYATSANGQFQDLLLWR